jgi:hypothetical protein
MIRRRLPAYALGATCALLLSAVPAGAEHVTVRIVPASP